ncbi:hypothetical protein GCM10017044_07600 [Kordiimonas sediminis]|uniref:DUF4136 domain-containing protein n=1 Tax=Kordiimonas sediminis TaxID=1735581 RepID=A0A919AN36_9PROT|nr:DUF4136 domain-containing protein [Kordiimonas sediminis]GHF15850.1 hypothetical protein GCM10017044_07600 [Kordiimonas sediminis]
MIKPFVATQKLLVIAAALMLGACSSYFSSDVSTFHTIGSPIRGTAAIVPMDSSKQESLEFRQYGAAIGYQLKQYGFSESGDNQPDYIVGFDVRISDGREKIYNRPASYAGYYNRTRYYWGHWGVYDPFYDPFQNELVAKTVYHAELFVEIKTPDGEVVYEGRSETDARENSLPNVVPLLAETLFKEFPGPNGVTRKVSIDLSEE